MTTMTWVGLDVHARSIEAAALDVITGELTRRRFGGDGQAVIGWLGGLPGPVSACYEAGPTGFGLYRAARAAGIDMQVIAPSKTPRAPGDRVKTDRKDAELLLRLAAAGALTPIAVPAPVFEAARDLARAREQVRADLMRARHRVSKLLLRYGRLWDGSGSTWTVAHRRWLYGQRFEAPATELAAWLGLTPTLSQSGQSSVSGSIGKTGSRYGRRILVEAAKHAGKPPCLSAELARRSAGQPATVRAIAWSAQQRLYRMSTRLRARGKPANLIAVAAARELACFAWAAVLAE
jgi:transposase